MIYAIFFPVLIKKLRNIPQLDLELKGLSLVTTAAIREVTYSERPLTIMTTAATHGTSGRKVH